MLWIIEENICLQVQETEGLQDGDETVLDIDNHSFGSNVQGCMFISLF